MLSLADNFMGGGEPLEKRIALEVFKRIEGVPKDLDIVLCVEALNVTFVEAFWAFVRDGKYQVQRSTTGEKRYYRFLKPENEECSCRVGGLQFAAQAFPSSKPSSPGGANCPSAPGR